MSRALTVHFRRIEGTAASMGWAGVKAIVADRPKGVAGGEGLGLSGGELMALSIGAGFHNQLHFSAAGLGIEITMLEIEVTVNVDEDMMVADAALDLHIDVSGGSDKRSLLLEHARRHSSISNSVARGFPVAIRDR